MLRLRCFSSFSLVAASGGHSLVAGLLIAGVLLLWSTALGQAGIRSCGRWAQAAAPGLLSTGSGVLMHGLSGSMARGVLPDQGLSPCLLHWQVNYSPLSRSGSPALD